MAKKTGKTKKAPKKRVTRRVNLAQVEAALDRIQLYLDDVRTVVAAMRKEETPQPCTYPSKVCKKPIKLGAACDIITMPSRYCLGPGKWTCGHDRDV